MQRAAAEAAGRFSPPRYPLHRLSDDYTKMWGKQVRAAREVGDGDEVREARSVLIAAAQCWVRQRLRRQPRQPVGVGALLRPRAHREGGERHVGPSPTGEGRVDRAFLDAVDAVNKLAWRDRDVLPLISFARFLVPKVDVLMDLRDLMVALLEPVVMQQVDQGGKQTPGLDSGIRRNLHHQIVSDGTASSAPPLANADVLDTDGAPPAAETAAAAAAPAAAAPAAAAPDAGQSSLQGWRCDDLRKAFKIRWEDCYVESRHDVSPATSTATRYLYEPELAYLGFTTFKHLLEANSDLCVVENKFNERGSQVGRLILRCFIPC